MRIKKIIRCRCVIIKESVSSEPNGSWLSIIGFILVICLIFPLMNYIEEDANRKNTLRERHYKMEISNDLVVEYDQNFIKILNTGKRIDLYNGPEYICIWMDQEQVNVPKVADNIYIEENSDGYIYITEKYSGNKYSFASEVNREIKYNGNREIIVVYIYPQNMVNEEFNIEETENPYYDVHILPEGQYHEPDHLFLFNAKKATTDDLKVVTNDYVTTIERLNDQCRIEIFILDENIAIWSGDGTEAIGIPIKGGRFYIQRSGNNTITISPIKEGNHKYIITNDILVEKRLNDEGKLVKTFFIMPN